MDMRRCYSFEDLCAHVHRVVEDVGGSVGPDNTALALDNANRTLDLEKTSWTDFLIVETSTRTPYHVIAIGKLSFLVSKGVHDHSENENVTLRSAPYSPIFSDPHVYLKSRHLANNKTFHALYGNDCLHRVDNLDHFIRVELVLERDGNQVPSHRSRVRREKQAFATPDLFDWIAFNLLSAGQISLRPETNEEAREFERWVIEGDPNYDGEQVKLDPIVYECHLTAEQAEFRSISALIISSLAYIRTKSAWVHGAHEDRIHVALRQRDLDHHLANKAEVQNGTAVVYVFDALTCFAVVAIVFFMTTSLTLLATRLFFSAGTVALASSVFVTAVHLKRPFCFNFGRKSRPALYSTVRVADIQEAANISGMNPSVVWAILLKSVLDTWPENKSFLNQLFARKSRLSDWLDAGAKTVVTREGELALHLVSNTLLVIRDDGRLVLNERNWDDWYERHFAYRRYLGNGPEDFNCSLIWFEGGKGMRVDDNISHVPVTWRRVFWKWFVRAHGLWLESKLFAITYRPRTRKLHGLTCREPSLAGKKNEARYLHRLLDLNCIPASILVRLDMEIADETEQVLSSPFEIDELDGDGVYEQLFCYEKVEQSRCQGIEKTTICIAISYKHHIESQSNRMPRSVWNEETAHLRNLMRFYGARFVRFWTDTRLSKLKSGLSDEWEKVGLAPYSQMVVYIVNSKQTPTLVNRFWLTAERRLGMATGGAHFVADDGKLVIMTSGVEDYIDPEILAGLNGVLASSSLLGDLYRDDKLRVIEKSIRKLETLVGPRWKNVVVNLPWQLTLYDFHDDFRFHGFEESSVQLDENWNASVDLLLSRRILSEIGEEVEFESMDLDTEIYSNPDDERKETFLAVVWRGEDIAAVAFTGREHEGRMLVRSVGKGMLVSENFVQEMRFSGFEKMDVDF